MLRFIFRFFFDSVGIRHPGSQFQHMSLCTWRRCSIPYHLGGPWDGPLLPCTLPCSALIIISSTGCPLPVYAADAHQLWPPLSLLAGFQILQLYHLPRHSPQAHPHQNCPMRARRVASSTLPVAVAGPPRSGSATPSIPPCMPAVASECIRIKDVYALHCHMAIVA